VINLRLQGTSIFWKEATAEAVFQLRAAVLSGRWEEILNHTREAMARPENRVAFRDMDDK
jgi:hypothetical protein